MFDKKAILKKVEDELRRELETISNAALQAREAAISEESKAEHKYDTRGLEASYLAEAQANRASEIEDSLAILKNMNLRSFSDESKVSESCIIETLLNAEEKRYFILLPIAGGLKVSAGKSDLTTLSIKAPLGKSFDGKLVGDLIEFKVQNKVNEYEITHLF